MFFILEAKHISILYANQPETVEVSEGQGATWLKEQG